MVSGLDSAFQAKSFFLSFQQEPLQKCGWLRVQVQINEWRARGYGLDIGVCPHLKHGCVVRCVPAASLHSHKNTTHSDYHIPQHAPVHIWGWNLFAIMVAHMYFSVNTTIHIYETHFWCAETLACVCAGARGVNSGRANFCVF